MPTSTRDFEELPAVENGPEKGNRLFPIFLKLENFEVLIVGGGAVGLEKLTAILRNSPATKITLVGEQISSEIRGYSIDFHQVVLLERLFGEADLLGKKFVIAATDDRVLNKKIRDLAVAAGLLVNVADTPELCDFYLSSVVQKGDLKLAISTNGKSPTIAKRLKEVLAEALPDEIDDILQNMPTIRGRLAGDFSEKVRILNALTSTLATGPAAAMSELFTEPNIQKLDGRKWRNIATGALVAFAMLLIFNALWLYLPTETWHGMAANFDKTFWVFVATGFAAQLVDGLLGMGYGVISQIVLMGTGVPLASISSSIHTAEMFTSGASGYAHYRFGNVNRRLFKALLVPGVIGAVAGAALLSWIGAEFSGWVKPFLAAYAMFLGLRILSRAFVKTGQKKRVRHIGWLAGAGGFLDSFGGGGWGPLVTSTLLARGKTPRYVLGSVAMSEFFITLASAVTFFSLIGISHWKVIAGLVVGGVVAAPFAARLAGKLPPRTMFIAVGAMVIFWSLWILVRLF